MLTVDECQAIIETLYDQSLRSATAQLGVRRRTFFEMIERDPDLASSYAAAQRARAELLADDVLDIADTEDDPARARNRIDARKWYAAAVKPRKFGAQSHVTVSGAVDIRSALDAALSRVAASSATQSLPSAAAEPVDAEWEPIGEARPRESTPLSA